LNESEKHWDLFISYASEDKEGFVDKLVHELRNRGLKVWYDDFILKIGDSIRQSIDKGIRNSSYGVVILSKNFFSKNWPIKELNALFNREDVKENVILPIWNNINKEEISNFSPLLADKKAIIFNKNTSFDKIADELTNCVLDQSELPIEQVKNEINSYYKLNKFDLKFKLSELNHRLTILILCNNELEHVMDESIKNKTEDLEEDSEEAQAYLNMIDDIRKKYKIPVGTYESFSANGTIKKGEELKIRKMLKKWLYGINTENEFYEHLVIIDELWDFDVTYVYFGIPRAIFPSLPNILDDIFKIGIRNTLNKDKNYVDINFWNTYLSNFE
jgi:hypothetical protein